MLTTQQRQTREYLEQPRELSGQIRALTAELTRVHKLVQSVGEVGAATQALRETEQELTKRIQKLCARRAEVEATVMQIPSERIRAVMLCRYIALMSVKTTSKQLHYCERQIKRYTREGIKILADYQNMSPNVPS